MHGSRYMLEYNVQENGFANLSRGENNVIRISHANFCGGNDTSVVSGSLANFPVWDQQ